MLLLCEEPPTLPISLNLIRVQGPTHVSARRL